MLVLRPLRLRLLSAFAWAFPGLVVAGIAAAALPTGWAAVVLAADAVVVAIAAATAFRIGLVADERRVAIRNHWRARELGWWEIGEVAPATVYVTPVYPMPAVAFGGFPAHATAATGSRRSELMREIDRLARARGVPSSLPVRTAG